MNPEKPSNSENSKSGIRLWAAAALIFVISLAAYSNSFNASFHFDDFHQIVMNPAVRPGGSITRLFTDSGTASFYPGNKGYRPLTMASFMLSKAVSGGRPWGFHLINFCIHAVNSFMVLLLVRAVLRNTGEDDTLVPFAAALAFSVHPVQTGAVTYASGRAVILAAFFCLAAFLVFIRMHGRYGAARILYIAAFTALYFAGLLSKEFVVFLPVAMVLYDVIMPRIEGDASGPGRFLYLLPLSVATACIVFLKSWAQGFVVQPEMPYGTARYMMSEAKAMLVYLRVLVFPVNQNADYHLALTTAPDIYVITGATVVVACIFFIVRIARRDPAAAFFGLWALAALMPESSLIPIGDIAVEYRLYLPAAGLMALAALMLLRKPGWRLGVAAVVIVLFCVLTFSRNRVWADELSFWGDTALKSPWSSRAHQGYGHALIQAGRKDEAIAELKRSLEKPEPRYEATAREELGELYFEKGRYEDATAMFEGADRLDGDPKAGYNLGLTYIMLGRYPEAAARLEAAERHFPDNFDLELNLAKAYDKTGRRPMALHHAEDAARLAGDAEQESETEELLKGLRGR